jgi:hypothetical protein
VDAGAGGLLERIVGDLDEMLNRRRRRLLVCVAHAFHVFLDSVDVVSVIAPELHVDVADLTGGQGLNDGDDGPAEGKRDITG